jgi:hypothetical protein
LTRSIKAQVRADPDSRMIGGADHRVTSGRYDPEGVSNRSNRRASAALRVSWVVEQLIVLASGIGPCSRKPTKRMNGRRAKRALSHEHLRQATRVHEDVFDPIERALQVVG